MKVDVRALDATGTPSDATFLRGDGAWDIPTPSVDYGTVADVQTANIPVSLDFIRTTGYSTVGDGGEALYIRVVSEPSHTGKIQSADGAWWEITPDVNGKLNGRAFGALGTYLDDAADDAPAIQNALDAAAAMGVAGVFLASGCYGIGSQIEVPRYTELRGVGSMMGTRWNTTNSEWVHSYGTNFAVTYGSGQSGANEAFSAFLLTSGSGIDGVSFWYPNIAVTNMIASPPTTHSPTIGLKADTLNANNSVANPFVRNCYVTNAYSFLCWVSHHGPGDIFNIKGFTCFRGFIFDNSYDIDRVVDVHWNPNMTYQGAWASNGMAWSALALQGAFLLLYKADQAYFNKVFCWGMYYGAWFTNNPGGISTNGAKFVQCGLEANNRCVFSDGAAQFIKFIGCTFGTQNWTTTYPPLSAWRISPASGVAYSWTFEACMLFRSEGQLRFENIRGIKIVDCELSGIANTAGGASIPAVWVINSRRALIEGNDIVCSGTFVHYVTVQGSQAIEVRNNFGKGAHTGTAPVSITSCTSGRVQNNYTNHGTLTVFTSGNTDVTADNLLGYTE